MTIFPAIDLKNGHCVRLRQGDFQQETRYSDDPRAMARQWETLGAEALHIVDLDGAVEGSPQNMPQVEAIARTLRIPIQVGGGIRHIEVIRRYLNSGVQRVVLGTAALEDHHLLDEACREFPQRILVGVDARDGQVALRGWQETSPVSLETFISTIAAYPLAGIVFTEITRDGMLMGPNLPALRAMAERSPLPMIASGGVTSLEDVQAIGRIGGCITGIIIGKALYEGRIDLAAAIRAVASEASGRPLC